MNAGNQWPILESAGNPPAEWAGWPAGSKFALVLTHDVEGQLGVDHSLRLANLESSLGFRSSFNFIPEGSYEIRKEFLGEFVQQGFEVGVHDLHHNGKLYRSKERFDIAAPRINHYLREWNAVGFRSGFMQRNLEWLHALNIRYDMSTFDTDPFEPQPDGAHTIFPFWVPGPSSTQHSGGHHSSIITHQSRGGYVELPYTLPQDSTLFLLLKENDISIWKRKLDWIASHGGMALINVHPDYLSFDGFHRHQYPSNLYREFLEYVRDRYEGSFCNLLPREVASLIEPDSVSSPAPEAANFSC
jgi:hypothetical protein